MGSIAFAIPRRRAVAEVGSADRTAPAAFRTPVTSAPAAPLAFAANGSVAVVERVTGPDQTRQHLEHLGFVPGASVRVESQQQGNTIVNVKGVTLALDAATARRVMVTV